MTNIDATRAAQLIYAVDAVLGILAIGGAALYGAAWSSGNVWTTSLAIFVPCAMLWSAFCYGAYRGLSSDLLVLKVLFWVHVVGNAIGFPVGTAVAAACLWLWRDQRGRRLRTA